jgi:hypothetical protein
MPVETRAMAAAKDKEILRLKRLLRRKHRALDALLKGQTHVRKTRTRGKTKRFRFAPPRVKDE